MGDKTTSAASAYVEQSFEVTANLAGSTVRASSRASHAAGARRKCCLWKRRFNAGAIRLNARPTESPYPRHKYLFRCVFSRFNSRNPQRGRADRFRDFGRKQERENT
jgi:hypothetical protein